MMVDALNTPNTISDRPTDDGDLDELMADPHCRYLVEYLRETEGEASLEAVSKYVVAEITGCSTDDVSPAVHRRVQTWLHHGQLPQLDDFGVVDFDPEAGTVRLAATADSQWRVDAPSLDGGP